MPLNSFVEEVNFITSITVGNTTVIVINKILKSRLACNR